MSFAVVLDTNVLYSPTLRDTVLRLAEAGLYRPLWSDHILDEVTRVLTRAGVDPPAVVYLVQEMTNAFEDALVEGYEPVVEAMESPDPDDRHVFAAAVAAGASGIVTSDRTGFPAQTADQHNLLIIPPDEFLLDLLDMAPSTVTRALNEQSAAYTRPPRSVEDILAALNRAGAPRFAAEILRHLDP